MVNFANDVEREEDYESGWDWIEEDTGPLIGPYTVFRQCLWIHSRINQKTSLMNCLTQGCTQ